MPGFSEDPNLWLYRIKLKDGRSFKLPGSGIIDAANRAGYLFSDLRFDRCMALTVYTTPEQREKLNKARRENLKLARAAKEDK